MQHLDIICDLWKTRHVNANLKLGLGSNLPAKSQQPVAFQPGKPCPGRGRSRKRLRKFIEIKTVRTQGSLGWARAGGKRSCAAATLSLIACLPVGLH